MRSPSIVSKLLCTQAVRSRRQNERVAGTNGARVGSADRDGRILRHLVRCPKVTTYLPFMSVGQKRANFAHGQEDGFQHEKNGVMPPTENSVGALPPFNFCRSAKFSDARILLFATSNACGYILTWKTAWDCFSNEFEERSTLKKGNGLQDRYRGFWRLTRRPCNTTPGDLERQRGSTKMRP